MFFGCLGLTGSVAFDRSSVRLSRLGEVGPSEFVVSSPQVLDEGMAPDDDAGGPVAFEAPHRPKPGLESPVVSFDSIIGVLGGVVKCSRQEVGNDSHQGGHGRW